MDTKEGDRVNRGIGIDILKHICFKTIALKDEI